jgi:DNA helicase-2/ATP-dependent DNA helicase PcrA
MALTKSQKAAVVYEQNLIIFAGPGSGKTSTFIAKGRRILEHAGTVLGMVTFTTAAAKEMQHRMVRSAAADGVTIPAHRIKYGTFHALALGHYQRHANNPKRLIAPPARSALLQSMLRELSIDVRQTYMLELDRYQGAIEPKFVDMAPAIRKFVQEYLAKLQSSHSTDLATVMHECAQRMRDGEFPLLGVSHLLGDEMQDADEVQLEFMLAHSGSGVITTLVADDDQTIYEWRNALGYAGLQQFARKAGAKTITLSENFRSRSEIIEHATRLIAFNDPHRIPKNQSAVRGPGGFVGARSCADLSAECKLVAGAINQLRREGESVAILARTNRSLDPMEEALATMDVTYVRESASIWSTREVATFMSLLRALVQGSTTDLLPALMLLDIDPGVRSELEVSLGSACDSFLDGEPPTLHRATATDAALVDAFAWTCARWRSEIKAGRINILIPNVDAHLQELFKTHFNEASHGSRRMKRVASLLGVATKVLTSFDGLLSRRLAKIGQLQRDPADPLAVRLLTMHSSKGLEFDTVYLIHATKPDDGTTLMEDQPERRLFYVALTRAKERFLVTYHDEMVKFIEEAQLPSLMSMAEAYRGATSPRAA